MKTLFDEFEEISPNKEESWMQGFFTLKSILIINVCIVAFLYISSRSIFMSIFMFVFLYIMAVYVERKLNARVKIAKKNGWILGVNKNSSNTLLSTRFSSLPKGKPSVYEEVVGKYSDETFYMGNFTATTGSGKSRHVESVNVLLLKLEKNWPLHFSIVKEGFFSSKDDIQLESIEFNKEFKIVYDPQRKQQIMQVLTPSLQSSIVELNKLFKIKSIELQENVILFSFTNDIFWSFGLTPDVTDSQISKVEEKISKMLMFADTISDIFDR